MFEPTSGERRWYGAPLRGALTIGASTIADVPIEGHNLSARHVRLVGAGKRIRIDVERAYAVRLDGVIPSIGACLATGSVLAIGSFELRLAASPPSGIAPIDASFLATLTRDGDDIAARLVYADSLEERGRVAEAAIVRGDLAPSAPASASESVIIRESARFARLAARAAPAWRRRYLPIAIEACARAGAGGCPGEWGGLDASTERDDGAESSRACAACDRRVFLAAHVGAARAQVVLGRPVALDPAVRRWPKDLRAPIERRPAIVMGRPRE